MGGLDAYCRTNGNGALKFVLGQQIHLIFSDRRNNLECKKGTEFGLYRSLCVHQLLEVSLGVEVGDSPRGLIGQVPCLQDEAY